MIEIKFRSFRKRYDDNNGKMYSWKEIIKILENRPDTIEAFFKGKTILGIPSRYTGFKDSLKREIYEGDICNDGSVVVFAGGRYLLMYKDGKFEDLIGDGEEVIGNIYENEDLIT